MLGCIKPARRRIVGRRGSARLGLDRNGSDRIEAGRLILKPFLPRIRIRFQIAIGVFFQLRKTFFRTATKFFGSATTQSKHANDDLKRTIESKLVCSKNISQNANYELKPDPGTQNGGPENANYELKPDPNRSARSDRVPDASVVCGPHTPRPKD